jgi:hypothetical protein
MAQESNMTNSVKQGKHLKGIVTRANEREGIERIGAAIGAALRANDKQVGGDHYKSMGVEPWHVIDTWPLEQRIGAYRAGALKYLMRMGAKDEAAQEIGKGVHYLEKLLEVLREPRDE